ncbi:hypothetical protein TFUB22_01336 [Tannerella forsythia]|nr:hypothetical protein TFUB22_01336 [Tannerella forsythia]
MDKGKVQLLGELLGVSALAFFAVKKTETAKRGKMSFVILTFFSS